MAPSWQGQFGNFGCNEGSLEEDYDWDTEDETTNHIPTADVTFRVQECLKNLVEPDHMAPNDWAYRRGSGCERRFMCGRLRLSKPVGTPNRLLLIRILTLGYSLSSHGV